VGSDESGVKGQNLRKYRAFKEKPPLLAVMESVHQVDGASDSSIVCDLHGTAMF